MNHINISVKLLASSTNCFKDTGEPDIHDFESSYEDTGWWNGHLTGSGFPVALYACLTGSDWQPVHTAVSASCCGGQQGETRHQEDIP